ncbi:MAG: NAD(P)H-hydrate epimerase [Candidatus Omnitrophica bacterium]|jgi:NAD(P)H-hydrate epimerase|nr:NAD(P)H-hydrate epimerase [Candidatus Omnitrophota bacterium]
MSVNKSGQRLLTARQSKEIDRRAQMDLGISTLTLMENAGRAVAVEAGKFSKGKIAVVCGKGNNGGDGFVAVRHLLSLGIKPTVFLAGKIDDVAGQARTNLDILIRLKQKVVEVGARDLRLIKRGFFDYGSVIDALLGVGLSGEARGIYKELIDLINFSKAYILSVDIPSGLDATTGKVLGSCVKADKTITFAAMKRGMTIGAGPRYCGKIVVADIGVPL